MKKKFLLFALLLTLLIPAEAVFATSSETNYVNAVLDLYDVSEEAWLAELAEMANATNLSEEEIAKQIYEELSYQDKLTKQEKKANSKGKGKGKAGDVGAMGPGGNGTYTLAASDKGNIFYETASTALIEHGHVGLYYSTTTLVESMPGDGVRRISRTSKLVDPGARVLGLTTMNATQKSIAANWADGRVGESYSYNFATNRFTSCVGDKNCSKLVWCAYGQTAGIDLDGNGGWGVYPKDIRDSSLTYTIISY